LTKALQEEKIKKDLFDKLCVEYKDDVIVFEWKGRWEYRKGEKAHLSRFNREFDIARFHRTSDKLVSPLLIGYEVKGMRRRKVGNNLRFYEPTWGTGLDQIEAYLKQNVDYAYLVTVKRKLTSENNDLVGTVKARKCVGLTFVEEINGELKFKEIVKPSKRNQNANYGLKITNLVAISLNERGCKDIQRQEWARKGEFATLTWLGDRC